MPVVEALAVALLSGIVSGLIAWGGLRVELRYHRRDIDRAHERADDLDERLRVLERGAG
jgi:hypothetical protein